MGRTVTCNYKLQISLDNVKNPLLAGAMKLKEILNIGKSYASAYKCKLVKIIVMPQTRTGERVMEKDFLIIDYKGKIDHYFLTDKIPFYTFE